MRLYRSEIVEAEWSLVFLSAASSLFLDRRVAQAQRHARVMP